MLDAQALPMHRLHVTFEALFVKSEHVNAIAQSSPNSNNSSRFPFQSTNSSLFPKTFGGLRVSQWHRHQS